MSFNRFQENCKFHRQEDETKKCYCDYEEYNKFTCNMFNCPLRRKARKELEDRLRRKATDEEYMEELKMRGLD
jgi:hypothetical protein